MNQKSRIGQVLERFSIRTAEERALRPSRVRADAVMTAVCWLLWLAALCFAPWHGEWFAALAVGTPLALAATLMRILAPGRLKTRLVMAVIFMMMSGLLIHESHGLIETHFCIFALLAFLLYYRDYRPVLLGAGVIAVHHYTACALQMRGWPIFVFPMGHSCDMVWVHAAYVVLETLVLMYLAATIRREALETIAIQRFGERVVATGTIDLRFAEEQGLRSVALDQLLAALDRAVSQAGEAAAGMRTVSADVASAAGEILSAGAQQQQSSESAVSVVKRMAGTAEDVTRHCSEISQVAQGSAAMVEDGRRTMDEAAGTIEGLVGTVLNVAAAMQGMHAESARIESIIRIMSDIVRQTDLLALNATIEAASAGEAGRGFNVVAQEIRELAMRTHHSLREAQNTVDHVREQTARVSAMAEECRREAEEGGRKVQTCKARLEQVVHSLPQIAQRSQQMIDGARRYHLLSEEVVAEMEGIGRTIAVTSRSLARIDTLGRSLGSMSAELTETVRVFRTDAGPLGARCQVLLTLT